MLKPTPTPVPSPSPSDWVHTPLTPGQSIAWSWILMLGVAVIIGAVVFGRKRS